MRRDIRDPETVGKALLALRENFPNKSAPERADLLEKLATSAVYLNGNDNGKK